MRSQTVEVSYPHESKNGFEWWHLVKAEVARDTRGNVELASDVHIYGGQKKGWVPMSNEQMRLDAEGYILRAAA